MSRQDKKSKFTQQKSNSSTFIIIGVVVVVLVAAAFYFGGGGSSGIEGTTNVGAENYGYQPLNMTTINPEITQDKVIVNIEEVKNNKFVSFGVPDISFTLANGTPFDYLPVLAYISPKGNLVIARALCEPCSGIGFYIQGSELVCTACDTRWSLETLKGISGGCPDHPPEIIEYEVDGNNAVIDMEFLKNWEPRPI